MPWQADLTPEKPEIAVAAGVLSNSAGEVLIAQRVTGTHMEGWWEFPGGKLDGAETPSQALIRELREELGVEVTAVQPLVAYPHDYPEKIVHLHVLRVVAYQGEPTGVEGQPLRWVPIDHLMEAGLLPADQPIVDALKGI